MEQIDAGDFHGQVLYPGVVEGAQAGTDNGWDVWVEATKFAAVRSNASTDDDGEKGQGPPMLDGPCACRDIAAFD